MNERVIGPYEGSLPIVGKGGKGAPRKGKSRRAPMVIATSPDKNVDATPADRVVQHIGVPNLVKEKDLLNGEVGTVGCAWETFNDVVSQDEKCGGRRVTSKSNFYLRNFIFEVGAIYIGFSGYSYTWCNKRGGQANIRERLDRVIASPNWHITFSQAEVCHLPSIGSDHMPVQLFLKREHPVLYRPFLFIEAWISDPSYEKVITESWFKSYRNDQRTPIWVKINSTAKALRCWNKNCFGFCQSRLHNLETQLAQIAFLPPSRENIAHQQRIQAEIEEWSFRMELVWHQKSRELWLQAGDRNSKFFHASTVAKWKKTFITLLKEDTGDYIQRSITDNENAAIYRIPTAEEIFHTIKSMHPIKAPGPDGMPALFFQTYWHIVGADTVSMVQNAFRSATLPNSINRTFLVLIPKANQISSFNQIRPISLCNTIYKILSKILANRLRPLMNKLIFSHQSTIILGRWIGEKTILVNEITHTMRKRRKGNGLVGFKIDLMKAYDRVDWGFLTQVLAEFGFSWKFNDLVLGWSPFIQLIFYLTEAFLTKSISSGVWDKEILYPRIYSSYTSNYFQGCCLNSKGKGRSMASKLWSGQLTNPLKSGCFFSRNTPSKVNVTIKKLFEIKELQEDAKYLGNPMFIGTNTSKAYEELRSKIESKMEGWKSLLLSQAGKYTLIKSVVSAVPLYAMAAFKFPIGWCREIERKASSFLWNKRSNEKHYVPIAWSRIFKPKFAGDLGLHRLQDMNLALLGKLGWLLATNSDKLWVKSLKAKYFAGKNFMKCTKTKNSSPAWHGILRSRTVLAKGLCYRVGKGNNINIWEDPWVPNNPNFLPIPASAEVTREFGMVDSLKSRNGCWDLEKIHRLFDREAARNIAKIPISNSELEDKIIWSGANNGHFTIKSAFLLEFWKSYPTSSWWQVLWMANIHDRVKFFIWKLANRGLPTASNLLRRNIVVQDPLCVHGYGCVETRPEKLRLISNPVGSLPVLASGKEDFFSFSTITLDQIWKARNLTSFEDTEYSLENSMKIINRRFTENRLIASKEFISTPVSMASQKFWKKPPAQFIKINTDAAVRDEDSTSGVVARDSAGLVRGIKAIKVQTDISELAEASGVLQGLLLAEELGCLKVWCESDAKIVVNNLNNPGLNSSHWIAEGVLRDILRLKSKFQEALFYWAPREENFLAHFFSNWCLKNNVTGHLHLCSLPRWFSVFVAQENGQSTNSLL
nr:uncharacterized protein LOC125418473 [Ziziphus jujuba var. spinosa]